MTFEQVIQRHVGGSKPLTFRMKTGEIIEGYVQEIQDGLITVRAGRRSYNARNTLFRVSQIASIENYRE